MTAIKLDRINHRRDCAHPATRSENAKCRAAKTERAETIRQRVVAMMADVAESARWMGEVQAQRYVVKAAVRLGLVSGLDSGWIYCARLLAEYRADLGGGYVRDGVTWSDIMRMYS